MNDVLKILDKLLQKIKEQSVNVPGYKAKRVLRIYLYLAILGVFVPIIYLLFILIFNNA